MKSIAALLFISIIIINDSHAQRISNEDAMNYRLPKKGTKFALANQLFELKDTSVVSPNAVYVQASVIGDVTSDVPRKKTIYNFIRFFKDGKALVSFDYASYPTEEEFNDLIYCRPAYYIIKDEQVIVEIYQDKSSGVQCMVARRLNNGDLEFYRLANNPDPAIKKNDKDTSLNRKDNRPPGFFYKRETARYKKGYAKLYKWL